MCSPLLLNSLLHAYAMPESIQQKKMERLGREKPKETTAEVTILTSNKVLKRKLFHLNSRRKPAAVWPMPSQRSKAPGLDNSGVK